MSYQLQKLMAETISAFSGLFLVHSENIRQFETGEYFVIYAKCSKRVQSILGAEREVLILGNVYSDQQVRSLKFARRIINESDGRLEPTLCVIVHQDPRGNTKLKRWGRENGIAVIPVYTSTGVLPREQEMERLLSFEFFTQDPFDITGPVANDSQFFGRRGEAQELARKLQSGHIRACFGIRKIGKTSILHRVLAELKENYDAVTVFIDCQRDDVFGLDAASLLESITGSLLELKANGRSYAEVNACPLGNTLSDAARQFQTVLNQFDLPVILVFDEIDYITPSNGGALQWRQGFVGFWRNVRAAYHAAAREDRKVSLLISGVSSRWFSVESIDGLENAALAFIPEEYLSPLPRGATNAMIKNIGAMAGLRFDEAALEAISSFCSDMPFWVRKACSSIHGKIETAARPVILQEAVVSPMLDAYGQDEGAALAKVALQHLFRVYPELRAPSLSLLKDNAVISASMRLTLIRYGIITTKGHISGAMMRAALVMVAEDVPMIETHLEGRIEAKPLVSEWAEELAGISYRRNTMERALRSLVINFLRMSALSSKSSPSAKSALLSVIPQNRRSELEPFNLDTIAEKLYWIELVAVINKHWQLFERIFGDKTAFNDNASVVNDRPDAHAKHLEPSDVALHRRALRWLDERITRV
ncbi:AAA-like domain-containing protein [Acetobacter senegalensis]|uniref:AAA-like domain-containing protein n=1 Tax=Acetobacter senegalensis TaxID=446692 RepID=UPI00209E5C3B|nr:AAA-like domain-containing protein [Acetobacter senegalensis]MCP1196015.1 AAA-like domain-containing protein [Acetobacter senegalensis]